MRPTERAPEGSVVLRDEEVADWLDANPSAALLFWDPDDAPCQRMRARLELVAAANAIPVGVMDVATDSLVAHAVGVKSVPTLVVFRSGDLVERLIGTVPEHVLLEALRSPHLGKP